jgi:ArsR family metal-binding transcriptional regulator
MLLKFVRPEVTRPPCDFSSETVNLVGRFAEDISPVLPYLNATQSKALYNRSANILRFRFEGRQVTLQPGELAISSLADADEAIEVLTRLQRLINDAWESRAEITPTVVERKRLQALQVYRLLPGLNCKVCDDATCFVFANKLAAGKAKVELCTPLCSDPAYASQREQLMAMVEAAI